MDQKSTFRKPCLLLFCLFISFRANAQVLEPGLAANLHAGATQAFTDVTQSDVNVSYGAALQYNIGSFSFFNTEYSMGRLSRVELDRYGKSYANNYKRVTATANISLGQFLDPDPQTAHYFIYNIYAGTGLGIIWTDISEPNALTPDNFGGITYKGMALTLPVNLGVNFKLLAFIYADSPISYNLNLQHNFAFTEMLDGYDPANSDNKMKDSFSTVNFGLKYNFGRR